MADSMIVYFKNHKSVRFDKNKVVFTNIIDPGFKGFWQAVDSGAAVVNWENVCFVREYEPPKEEEYE